MVGGAHLSDPTALALLGLQWGQRGPGALGTLGNLENPIYPEGLEGQNLEDPLCRSHLSPLNNLNRNEEKRHITWNCDIA